MKYKTRFLFIFTIILFCSLALFACNKTSADPVVFEKYTVTVVGGTGGGEYEKGETVTIVAEEKKDKVFLEWQVAGERISDEPTFSFTVTDDITVIAFFDYIAGSDKVIINVVGGTGGGEYEKGETVTIVAEEKTDKVFSEWQVGGEKISEKSTYSFTATKSVTIIAFFDYKSATEKYTVTVVGGTGGGEYKKGETVTIVAPYVEGKTFTEWQVGGKKVSSKSTYSFTVTKDVVITSVYKVNPKKYYVTVEGGQGSGEYVEGDIVTAVAEQTSIRVFVKWQSDGETVSDESTYSFAATENVTISAVYDYIPSALNYYVPDNTEQIKKSATPIYSEGALSFAAAKGEKESGQVILYDGIGLSGKRYSIDFGDLTEETTGAVIEKSNLSTYIQHYVNVTANWDSGTNSTSYYPNGKPVLGTGYYPDALIPYEVAVFSGENSLSGEGGNNNGLWFTLSVPENAKEGQYKGTLTVAIEDDGYLFIPVYLTVYDFSMPSQTYFKSNVSIWSQFHEFEGVEGYEPAGYFAMEMDYYQKMREFLAERKISAEGIQTHYFVAHMGLYAEKAREVTLDGRIGSYDLLPMVKRDVSLTIGGTIYNNLRVVMEHDEYYNESNYLMGLKTLLVGLAQASTNEVNLFKKAIIRVPENDEPGGTIESFIECVLSENVIRRSINYALYDAGINWSGKEEVKEALKNLTVINTTSPGRTALFTGGSQTFYYKSENGTHKITKKGSGLSEYFNPTPSVTVSIPADHTLYYDETKDDASTRVYVDYNKIYGACPEFNYYRYGTEYYNSIMNMKNDGDPATHVWWYSCCNPEPPYASLFINAPMIKLRANRFVQFSIGIEGELYYCANRWNQEYIDGSGNIATRIVDPWVDPNRVNGCNGDGMLIYPALNRYAAYNATKSQDEKILFCSSLRLENYMESADDYDYLCLAQSLIEGLTDNEAKANAQTRFNGYIDALFGKNGGVPDPYTCTADPSVFKTARANIANLIVELKG